MTMLFKLKKEESEITIKDNTGSEISTTKTKNIKKLSIPKTAQQTIPFIEMYESGVMLVEPNKYTLVFGFENIDYTMLREEDKELKFKLYSSLMNIIPPDIHYQEFITNSSVDKNELKKVMLPSEKRYEKIYDEYVNVQSKFIADAENTAIKKHYIALSYKPISKRDDAQRRLLKTMRDFDVTLKKLESSCRRLKPEEIFELLYNYYHPFSKDDFRLPKNLFKRGKTIKDYIAPSSFTFKHNYTIIGSAYTRIFYVKDYPDELSDTFIADLLDNNYKISIAKHVDHIDKSEALEKLKQRVVSLEEQRQKRLEENKKNGTDYVPLDLQEPIDEANEMRKALKKDQELFVVGLYISLSAETKEELEDITKTIVSICRRHVVSIDTVTTKIGQEQAINTILPFANDKLKILRSHMVRTMLTDSTAIMLPFSVQNIYTPTGFYYGKNSITNSPIILDRRNDKNSNGFILGKPGSGKSMKMKREIIDVLMKTDDDVIIIDPEREFTELAKAMDGEVIYLEPSSDTYINPFDINEDYADGDDPFKEKSDFILTNLEILKGDLLTPKERTIADRCVILAYKDFRGNGIWDYSKLPTYRTFYEILKQQPEKEARDLALYIESYVLGSFNIFAKETNVNLKNRLTVFDQQKIGTALKKFGMQVTIDFIWQRLIENRKRGKNTWLYVDEFYLYFDDTEEKKTGTATAFLNYNKRCRKYGGSLTGATQNVTQVMQSPEARLMLNNSQFLILLDQTMSDREEISKLLNLSTTQEGYIKNVEKGSGLIVSGKRIIPFNDEYPKDNRIYEIITTDPKDVQKKIRNKEQKEGEKIANDIDT